MEKIKGEWGDNGWIMGGEWEGEWEGEWGLIGGLANQLN